MKGKWLAVVVTGGVLALAAGAQEQGKKPGKTDEEKLQGTWNIAAMERMGMEATDEKIKDAKLVFTAGNLRVHMNGEVMDLTYKLDPGKKPKQINFTEIGQGGKEQVHQGIYQFDGDTIKICFSHAGNPRPTEFTTNGSDDKMITLKRAKE